VNLRDTLLGGEGRLAGGFGGDAYPGYPFSQLGMGGEKSGCNGSVSGAGSGCVGDGVSVISQHKIEALAIIGDCAA
jgi:hypothetical protein